MEKVIVITNVDSLLGYALAYRFLEDWNREEEGYNELRANTEFRLLCHERQGLEELELLGGKVYEVKKFGDDEPAMNTIMKDVYYVMYVPENSENRTGEGEAVLKAAKNQKVDYVAMFSYVGLDQLDNKLVEDANVDKLKNLKQYQHLEKRIAHHFDKNNHCIFRSTIWNQFFYYFGPMIEEEHKICLPVDKERKWGSIDLAEYVDAVYNLSNDTDDKEEEQTEEVFDNLGQLYISNLKKKNKTLFEFTPCNNITAEKLVEYASKALEREKMTYNKVHPAILQDYLSRIHNDNRFRLRPIQHLADMGVIDGEKDGTNDDVDLDCDRPYTFPLAQYLNDNFIQTLIEYWLFVDIVEPDKTTEDLQLALGHKPQDVFHFFKRNRDQFRRLR